MTLVEFLHYDDRSCPVMPAQCTSPMLLPAFNAEARQALLPRQPCHMTLPPLILPSFNFNFVVVEHDDLLSDTPQCVKNTVSLILLGSEALDWHSAIDTMVCRQQLRLT